MKKSFVFFSWCCFILLMVALLFSLMGFRINTSDSIPKGLYRLSKTSNFKNKFALFCPSNTIVFKQGLARGYIDHGLCPHGFGYLMKKVVAVKGDVVSSTKEGFTVNGQRLRFSKPKTEDGLKRPLIFWQVLNYQLKEDEVLTMTTQSPWSFDGRYYGLVSTGQLKGMLKPILTWPQHEKR